MTAFSIAVDSNGVPHVAYIRAGALKYAKRKGPTWDIQFIDSLGPRGDGAYLPISLVLDPRGRPRIGYHDFSQNLKYAQWTGNSWSSDTVQPHGAGKTLWQTATRLDIFGNPHFAYYESSGCFRQDTGSAIRYTGWTGTSWSAQTVDAVGICMASDFVDHDIGKFASLDVDAGSNNHMVYMKKSSSSYTELRYAQFPAVPSSHAPPPTLTIDSPVFGSTASGRVLVSGTATNGTTPLSKIEVQVDGRDYVPVSGLANWTYLLDTAPLFNGVHHITARATDIQGRFQTSSLEFRVFNLDVSSPTVQIQSPRNGATVSGVQSITVQAMDDVAVLFVDFYIDGKWIEEDRVAPYTYDWNTTKAADGPHTIMVKAFDPSLKTGSHTVTVTVSNNDPPQVTIRSPKDGATVFGVRSVVAEASDDVGVTRVEFYIDGSRVGADTAAPYVYNWDTTKVDNGPHQIKVKAYDAGGKTGSDSISVRVSNVKDTTPPKVSILSPKNGSAINRDTLAQAQVTDDVGVAKVEFYVDQKLLAADTSKPYTATIQVAPLSSGNHVLLVKGYDAAGNMGKQSVSFYVVKKRGAPVVEGAPSLAEMGLFGQGVIAPDLGGIVGDEQADIASVKMSPQAVDQPVQVDIKPEKTEDAERESLKGANVSDQGLEPAGVVVEVDATETIGQTAVHKFAKPLTLSLTYDPLTRADPRQLGIYYWDEGGYEWKEVPGASVDQKTGMISVNVDHLTTFGVFADPKKPATEELPTRMELKQVFVYPNPVAGGKATLHMELGLVDRVEVQIYDLTGSLVKRLEGIGVPSRSFNGEWAYELGLDAGDLASGIYMYLVKGTKDGETVRITKKFAVAR